MSNSISSLTTIQLRRAADLKEKIEALTKELNSLLGTAAVTSAKAPAKTKGKISAAGRARIAAAAKARWAKVKAAKPVAKLAVKAPLAVKTPSKKRGLSTAAKAKLSALAKARWAKVKATGKKSL